MLKLLVFLLKILPIQKRKALIEAGYISLSEADSWRSGRFGTKHFYGHLKSLGWQPKTLVDVGAYEGTWTAEMLELFPDTTVYCVEALDEKIPALNQRFPSNNVLVYHALVGPSQQTDVAFFASESGSSVMQELSAANKQMRMLNMTTLDSLLSNLTFQQPMLLKLDVQGFELEVLKGANNLLQQTDLLQLEVSWLNYNQAGPGVGEVMQALAAWGFVPLEIAGLHRRKDNWALVQSDIIFCRPDWPLRATANDFTGSYEIVAF